MRVKTLDILTIVKEFGVRSEQEVLASHSLSTNRQRAVQKAFIVVHSPTPQIKKQDANGNSIFWVHKVDAPPGFTSLSSPSHPGPHLLLLFGVALVLGLPLMAAVEALQQAVSLRLQPVLHALTRVPVGLFSRGAFGHCWPTTVQPRRSIACRNTVRACSARQ